jgi:DNA-binding NarL/FixJ family response regulator
MMKSDEKRSSVRKEKKQGESDNTMINVLIADDHPVVRQGIKQILAEDSEIGELGEAKNSQEVMEQIRQNSWDVIILDITMPGRGGLDTLKEIKGEKPKLPVLILSIHPEDQYAVRALKAGAAGYLTKESAPDDLIKAIKKVNIGGKYISNSLAEKLALHLERDAQKQPHESLSDREYQVLCMIASGKKVKDIAESLSLSVKTISTYRARILEKMKMKSNADLIHYAIQNRLVS